jgi:hypothetical protein
MSLKSLRAIRVSTGVVILLLSVSSTLLSDQIQMQNGDQYVGRVVSLTTNVVIVESEILGTIRLPRARVAGISLGSGGGTTSVTNRSPAIAGHRPQQPKPDAANTEPDFAAALRQMQSDTNSMHQIQKQFLSDATPEANKKFNEMAQSLMTGQMSLSDLRAQAASAAEQLKALKSQGGDEIGSSLDGYLAILESFLKETPAPGGAPTNRITHVQKPRVAPDGEE